MLKLVVVLALTVLLLGALWVYGKILSYVGAKSSRRSTAAEHEMRARYQHPPNHRRSPPNE
jgi:hypothetical protein